MKNYQAYLLIVLIGLFFSCGGGKANKTVTHDRKYSPTLGIGEFTSIELENELDMKLVKKGDDLYMQKCASCHDLSKKVIVGPGWEGVTERRNAVWLMNLMTNTEEMLEKDLELKKQIRKYDTQMPDFWLSKKEARALLEFMRKNDLNEVNRDREMPSACKHIGRN